MTVSYFIARDGYNEEHVWRDGGEFPVPVLPKRLFEQEPALWGLLAAAIPRRSS